MCPMDSQFQQKWGDYSFESNLHEPILWTNLRFIPYNCLLPIGFESKGAVLDYFRKHMPNPWTVENYHVRIQLSRFLLHWTPHSHVMLAYFWIERSIKVDPLYFLQIEALIVLWWVEAMCMVVELLNCQIITYVHDLILKWHHIF
jgi:hypothetical protein